ncbi:MAG: NTP transferase domain-containing protein [Candidatus Pacebacteria bacterium]|nr:NTP transferase domain-containing protein [Candidatus Paceibacterota bacterium]MBP9818345.1 NTP transferase domain-containing protein [Candidatus Paceibacterota bacterium]
MKLVILAAGKGKRMGESSNYTPKPILKYKGKTLIQHKLEQIPTGIEEIIIVIGHLGEKIVEAVGHSWVNSDGDGGATATDTKSIPITYVLQKEQLGSAHSLWQAKDAVGDSPFLVLMGDDLYSKSDLEDMITLYTQNPQSWIALIEPQEAHIPYGKSILDKDGYLIDFRNDPNKEVLENLMYTGACLLTPDIFKLPLVKISETEYGLPHTFVQEGRHALVSSGKLNIPIVKTTYWKRITTPEDLV